eukprot:365763-Chlamydomonas_euryale.AAC.4
MAGHILKYSQYKRNWGQHLGIVRPQWCTDGGTAGERAAVAPKSFHTRAAAGCSGVHTRPGVKRCAHLV